MWARFLTQILGVEVINNPWVMKSFFEQKFCHFAYSKRRRHALCWFFQKNFLRVMNDGLSAILTPLKVALCS